MEDLSAAYQELVSALAGVMEAEERSAGDAVERLRVAKRAVTDACDRLEGRLIAAQQRPAADGDGKAAGAAAADAVAAGLDAFRAKLLE